MIITKVRTPKITALFMGQTDLKTGLWFPIKKMTWKYLEGKYVDCVTRFTVGAQKLQSMYPDDPYLITFGTLEQIRQDKDIQHSQFAKRMPVNHPVKAEMLFVLGLDPNSLLDPVEYVSRSGGYRYGDSNDLFPEVEADSRGNYIFYFRPVSAYEFASLKKTSLEKIGEGNRVKAVMGQEKVKLQCQGQIIGSAPGYIDELIKKYPEGIEISIAQVNKNVPAQYQYLLVASLNQEIGKPFTEIEYQPIK